MSPVNELRLFATVILFATLCHSATAIPPECANITLNEFEVGEFIFQGNHSTWQRPVRNALKPIEVGVRLIMLTINDVIEKFGTMKLTGYLLVRWNDDFKIWNSSFPYSCLPHITVPSTLIWLPDLAVANADNHYDLLLSKNAEKARIFSNGTIIYRPGGTFTVYCAFNLRWFPFDTHTCELHLEGWRMPTITQKLVLDEPAVTIRYWRDSEQWHLVNMSGYSTNVVYFSGDVYGRVTFSLMISRKIGYYLMNVIIPSVIISVAQLTIFSLPIGEVVKIQVSFTCLLAYGVFQLMIIEDMPRASDGIPLLSIYIDLSMSYIAASMVGESAVFISIQKATSKHSGKMPRWLFALAKCLSYVLFLHSPKRKELVTLPPDLLRQYHPSFQTPAKYPFDGNKSRLGAESRKEQHEQSNNYVKNVVSEDDSFTSDERRVPSEKHHHHSSSLRRINSKCNHNRKNMAAENNAYDKRNRTVNIGRDDYHSLAVGEWQFLAKVAERMTFVSYLFLIIVTPTVMFAVLPNITWSFFNIS